MSYQILSALGKGSFGSVYHLKLPNSREYALKVIGYAHITDTRDALKEPDIMMVLEHPHILQCCCVGTLQPGCLFLLLEYCERGTLTSAIAKGVSEDQAITWFIQMADALKYLHGKKVMHRDIKPDNILLDRNNDIKVGDLGIARIQEFTAQGGGTVAGTNCYMSPQILQKQPYKDKTDVWSLGCVFHQVLSKRPPFTESNLKAVIIGPTPHMPSSYSARLRNLVVTILDRNELTRPSAVQMLRDLISLQGKPYSPRRNARLQKEVVDQASVLQALMTFKDQQKRLQASESSSSGISGWWLLGAGAVAGLAAVLIAGSGTPSKESDAKKSKK